MRFILRNEADAWTSESATPLAKEEKTNVRAPCSLLSAAMPRNKTKLSCVFTILRQFPVPRGPTLPYIKFRNWVKLRYERLHEFSAKTRTYAPRARPHAHVVHQNGRAPSGRLLILKEMLGGRSGKRSASNCSEHIRADVECQW